MTIRVTVKNEDSGSERVIIVAQQTGGGMAVDGSPDTRLAGGESCEKCVHSTNRLVIVESGPPHEPYGPQEPIMQFFAWGHLPPHLQSVSRPFGELAGIIANTLPQSPERTVALRKLLESKDAAVRAKLFKE